MKLFSKIYGDKGQDLIIIHGLFGMGDNWRTLGKQFSKYCKVHLIDLRNHGKSPHAKKFNYEVICEDLFEYINDNNIKKSIILGHSLGGKAAIKLAFTYPDKVEKLIVADASLRSYNTESYKDILRRLNKLPFEDFEKRDEVDKALSLYVENQGVRWFLLKNLYKNEEKKFSWRFNIDVLLKELSTIQESYIIDGVCDIPTHFIKGGKSDHINSNDELLIKKHFSDFSIVIIDGAGHWLHAEAPEKFYNEVMGFCLT